MELLELYLFPLNNPRQFHANATFFPDGMGDASKDCELPFWVGEKDWRKTVIKVLESSQEFRPEHFPEIGEQDWLEQEHILLPGRQDFDSEYLRRIGQALYHSLFPPDSTLKQVFQQCLRLVEQRNTDLHLRLKFSEDSVQRARIADYPWELLHDGQRFLLHHKVRLSRYIAYEASPPRVVPQETLRVLLISARPHGLPQLSQEEQQAIHAGIQRAQDAGLVKFQVLSSPTRKALNHYLTNCLPDELPQVLHFDGHGVFGKRCTNLACLTMHPGIKAKSCCACGRVLPDAQGHLSFETEQGEPDWQSARQVAAILQAYPTIALVVLSACQSGMAVAGDSVFNGMAQNFIDQRIPAVVAMQYSVRADAARDFAEQFYRVVGKQEPLLAAINQGIRAMDVEGNQWYRPVLYLRWTDDEGGQLFAKNQEIPVSRTQTDRLPKWLNSRFSITALTGIGVTAVVLLVRVLGCLQPMELSIYDHLLRISPTDSPDKRLTIIEATKADLAAQRLRGEPFAGGSSISSRALEDVLQILSEGNFKPSIIVLDLYRDFGKYEPLKEIFQKIKKDPTLDLYVVCESSYKESGEEKGSVPPPLEDLVSHEHVGFSNFSFDGDQVIRRQLIEMSSDGERSCLAQHSLSFLVAKRYLEKLNKKQVKDEEVKSNDDSFILNGTQLKRISTWAFGGYQDFDPRGVQFMLRYNAPDKDLRKITKGLFNLEYLRDNKEKLIPADFKDRIVLIGITGEDAKDRVKTPYGETYGVFVHAQMISQLISAVSDHQPLIWVLPQWGEAGLVLLWGITGGFLGAYIKSRRISLLIIGVGAVTIYVIAAVTMIFWAGWLPTLPLFLVLFFSEETARYLYQKTTLSLKTSS